ncbi:MAG: ComEC/Rec2 family competence protein [Clostridia bacterium]|nr:ComEC/Rec2 family competence protein [Clostridia bacterium]
MKKLVNFRPIVFLALSLICGILLAYGIILSKIIFSVIISLVYLISASYFLFLHPFKDGIKKRLFIFVFFFVIFLVGFSTFSISLNNYKKADLDNHYYTVSGKITDIKKTEYGASAVISKVDLKGIKSGKTKYKILLTIYGENDFDIGDYISFDALLIDNGEIFDNKFSANNISKKVKYSSVISESEIKFLYNKTNVFEKINIFIRDTLNRGLEKEQFSVAYAMLTGDSSYINENVILSYRSAGVAHIFAVSGLHIGFVATAVGFILRKCKVKNSITAIAVILSCFFYSGICGFSASSIRASIMCAVLYLARLKYLKYDDLTSISLASLIILLISPIQLFTVGFELSFAVVLGILVLSKPITKLFKFLPQKIGEALGVVLSAQLFSIPILLYYFNQFSLFSVIANLLFIPIVGVVFILLLVSTIFGGIFKIEKIILFPSNFILKIINIVINAIDYKVFIFGGFVLGAFVVFYYFALLFLTDLINLKVLAKKVASISCAVICVLGSVGLNLYNKSITKFIISGSETINATIITYNNTSTMVVSEANFIYSNNALKRLKNNFGKESVDYLILVNVDSIQTFYTKFNTVFSAKNIIYYGEKNSEQESIMQKSFPKVKCYSKLEEEFNLGGIEYYFVDFGGVIGKIKDKKFGIFSNRENSFNLGNQKEQFELLIVSDSFDEFNYYFSPNKLISYILIDKYDNAIENGVSVYKIK